MCDTCFGYGRGYTEEEPCPECGTYICPKCNGYGHNGGGEFTFEECANCDSLGTKESSDKCLSHAKD